MEIPEVVCSIEVFSSINPSEDPQKIEQAISNVLQNMKIQIDETSAKGTSKNLESLLKIQEFIHLRRKQRIYRRNLEQNLNNDSTWFYLNKQAAFVGTIALCGESDESPLGPIKVVLSSKEIGQVIDWLIS